MRPNDSPSLSVSRCGHGRPGSDPCRTVVWVRGEQDIATRTQLSVTIGQAARLDDADIVVDLSGVTFMDASTVGALVVARSRLRARSRSLSACAPPRSLTVRAPTARARRLLDLCGLSQLIDDDPPAAAPTEGTALGSWVGVPARDRDSAAAPPPADQEICSPAPVPVTLRARVELPALVHRARAPS